MRAPLLLTFLLATTVARADAPPAISEVVLDVADREAALEDLARGPLFDEPIGRHVTAADTRLLKLGLLPGDVVRGLDGRAIVTASSAIEPRRHGAVVYLDVARGPQRLVLRVVARWSSKVTATRDELADVIGRGSPRDVTAKGAPSGVVVTASVGPFEAGDVVRAVDKATITTVAQLGTALGALKADADANVKLERDGAALTLAVHVTAGVNDAVLDGIVRVDDSHFTVKRAALDAVLANPMEVAKGARVVPSIKDGKPHGFKLYAIRPTSMFARLGLANGDTLLALDHLELSSADKALEAYTKLREAKSVVLEIERRGKPLTLTYTIQ